MNRPHNSIIDHWIDTDQGRLFARCWRPESGDVMRAPIVLLHDSLGCIALWRSFPAMLAQKSGRVVIAYDRLGYGQSDTHHGEPGRNFIAAEARDVFPAVQRHFGFERFVAIGHSVGGCMAVHCAASHAAACDALVTLSAQAFVEERTRAGIREAREMFRQAEHFTRLQRYHGDKADWVLNAWIDTWLAPDFADWSLHDVLPEVRCPSLVMHGSEDEYGSTDQPERIAARVSGPVQLDILPGLGHVPHREQEDRVVARIAGFLSAV
nr:alpha/beta hydrolase [uncultured Pseudogulbenkiania sp.]